MKKTIKGWAVVFDDGFLPDLKHDAIGSFYHINSSKADAYNFVKKSSDGGLCVVPVTITYTLPKKPLKNKK